MEVERLLSVCIDEECIRECIEKAKCFDPCLSEFASKEGAIIDIYIQNVTSVRFYLSESNNVVFSGFIGESKDGLWVIPPPKRIKGGETVFMRAYTKKVSTTKPEVCAFPVEISIDVSYKSDAGTFSFSVNTDRETDGGGCEGLQVFKPITVSEFGTKPTPASFKVLYLQPPTGDREWRNTAYFLIS